MISEKVIHKYMKLSTTLIIKKFDKKFVNNGKYIKDRLNVWSKLPTVDEVRNFIKENI